MVPVSEKLVPCSDAVGHRKCSTVSGPLFYACKLVCALLWQNRTAGWGITQVQLQNNQSKYRMLLLSQLYRLHLSALPPMLQKKRIEVKNLHLCSNIIVNYLNVKYACLLTLNVLFINDRTFQGGKFFRNYRLFENSCLTVSYFT